ncbi:hypothetical protein GDO86_019333 [Hymenochirus boettgeri]|uniref:Uncharacterized protein n=1 Tax=Hymenochirus boettgeri TaxID=247094 RepID=A0A8T2IH28_9PIPI|nr:hypothetical protein GDO86_019333 [Hymenochirus boettgeri]
MSALRLICVDGDFSSGSFKKQIPLQCSIGRVRALQWDLQYANAVALLNLHLSREQVNKSKAPSNESQQGQSTPIFKAERQ